MRKLINGVMAAGAGMLFFGVMAADSSIKAAALLCVIGAGAMVSGLFLEAGEEEKDAKNSSANGGRSKERKCA